ncbi:MAG TPA: hypothetical protein VKQ71_17825, partial [Acidimicrobiales bacterium]|nr:hypothetical protein [Acidimicrobiales bacterium]
PRVLYVSTHEAGLWPGTGHPDETGGPRAPGTTVNLPLPRGATGDVLLAAFDDVAHPVIDRFDPTWVLVSAGFDAHRRDPLADLALSAGDFADLAARVMSLSPRRGRVVAFLEGGYDLPALRASVGAVAATLAGGSWRPEPASSGGPGRDWVTDLSTRRLRSPQPR